jgi:hypothetical protein
MTTRAALAALAALTAAAPLAAQELERPLRPVHTYSIVARDAATGQLGVAVQSHWFSVGSIVSWAEPGVGAVATQSFVEASYGPLGLELMRAGKTAPQALKALLAGDEHTDVRQVAMVDADGLVAVHTGENAIIEHCDHTGDAYSVQANLMLESTVCDVMVKAYESTQGDLAERLMAALEAAQAEGGVMRWCSGTRPRWRRPARSMNRCRCSRRRSRCGRTGGPWFRGFPPRDCCRTIRNSSSGSWM